MRCTEKATPGYYGVTLDRSVKVEATCIMNGGELKFDRTAATAAATAEQTGFTTDYDAALKRAAEQGKRTLVLFTGSDWCVWCKKLDDETFAIFQKAQKAIKGVKGEDERAKIYKPMFEAPLAKFKDFVARLRAAEMPEAVAEKKADLIAAADHVIFALQHEP